MTLFGLYSIRKGRVWKGDKFFSCSRKGNRASNLAEITPGCRAKVQTLSANVSPDRQAHLYAYGLLPGRSVLVLQHRPVTVVRIENFELAIERELAAEIGVEEVEA